MTKPRVNIKYSYVKIMRGADMSQRQLPLMTAKSTRPGPVVWLTAASHGDEICSIAIIQEVFKKIRRQLLCGTIQAFPLMNPMGFEAVSRHITESSEDLNRSFPGTPDGSLGERVANRIFSSIIKTSPDLVLDLHTDDTFSIPYVFVDPENGALKKRAYKKAMKFAGQTGLAVVIDRNQIPESLSYNLLAKNIPALTLELGEPRIVNETNVVFGLQAIYNILAFLNMTAPPKKGFRYPLPEPFRPDDILLYSDQPYSSKSGVVRFLLKPGDTVKKGQPFARVVNAFGEHRETLRARSRGLVLGHANSSVAYPGMQVMAFGIPGK